MLQDAKCKDLFVTEAKEAPEIVPANEKPTHWRRYTPVAVNAVGQAMEVFDGDTLRWQIQPLFRGWPVWVAPPTPIGPRPCPAGKLAEV